MPPDLAPLGPSSERSFLGGNPPNKNTLSQNMKQLWSSANDSAPSEARKRGSGGGSPRKYDDFLTGPSELQGK
jgi:hypothetical protein